MQTYYDYGRLNCEFRPLTGAAYDKQKNTQTKLTGTTKCIEKSVSGGPGAIASEVKTLSLWIKDVPPYLGYHDS